MIEVVKNLFVGSGADSDSVAMKGDWGIVTAAKEPWHRDVLGYTGHAAPKTHPEYLMARRGNRLICNLVDAPHHSYFGKTIIDAAIKHVGDFIGAGVPVLVHCNEGRSRSCLVAMLYLATTGELPESFEAAEQKFRSLYPPYNPGAGAKAFLALHYAGYWRTSCQEK